ncbi:TPA: hypothetical protein QDA94_006412, partial [Burkholderia vietnamiensis]|nr:hypothetical protein [Burkholderia vietnamiensis]
MAVGIIMIWSALVFSGMCDVLGRKCNLCIGWYCKVCGEKSESLMRWFRLVWCFFILSEDCAVDWCESVNACGVGAECAAGCSQGTLRRRQKAFTLSRVGVTLLLLAGIVGPFASEAMAECAVMSDQPCAEGDGAMANGKGAVAEGDGALANGDGALAQGDGATANGKRAMAFGDGAMANGKGAAAGGDGATANGKGALASGDGATANGKDAGAWGDGATANGKGALAGGDGAT